MKPSATSRRIGYIFSAGTALRTPASNPNQRGGIADGDAQPAMGETYVGEAKNAVATALGTNRLFPGFRTLDDDRSLRFGEAALLIEGLNDDVSFFWALIRLGIRTDLTRSSPPESQDIEEAFSTLARLLHLGYFEIGRLELLPQRRGGQVIVHVPERLETVLERVRTLCGTGSTEWPNACWLTNTDKGDDAVREHLRLRPATPRHRTQTFARPPLSRFDREDQMT